MNAATSVRAGRPEACDSLADLWVASWQDTMPAIDFSARRSWILARLQTWPDAGVLVAYSNNAPQGFLLLDTATGFVDQLVVTSAAKGGGGATVLLAAARDLAPSGLVLDVNADNARAVRFYLREGFRIETEGRNAASGLKTWRMRARAPF